MSSFLLINWTNDLYLYYNKTMKISEYIAFTIDRLPKGYVFHLCRFYYRGEPKEAVIKALNRMVASGKIAKLSKGKYYKPENTPLVPFNPIRRK